MSVRLANALESLIGIIAVVGVCLAVRDRREGRMETWGHYLKRGCALWGRALGICLWVGLIVGGLTLLFIVPGVIASVCLALAVQAAILLDLSPKQALSESRRMVKGHWWSTLGVLTLGGVVTALAGLAVALPTGLLSGVMEGLAEEIGGVSPLFKSLELLLNVVGTTLVDIVGVFWTICMTVWFFRLREGMKPAQEAV